MKKRSLIFTSVLFISSLLFSQSSPNYDDYFIDATMRIDYYHIGDAQEEIITIDQVYRQGIWAGNPKRLIDPFRNGKYCVKIYDAENQQLIYSKGFDSYFGEYRTTDPAIEGIKRTYHETALIPYPKHPVFFALEVRDKENVLHEFFRRRIDPDAIGILNESSDYGVRIYETHRSGDSHTSVDLAWVAEGYQDDEYESFKSDVDRYVNMFFTIAPYDRFQDQFNIYGVFKPSMDHGVDEPRNNRYRKTVVGSSFNALGLSRYLLTEDNRSLRDIASAVPYDGVVILVKSDRYGGGGIYNFYAISTVDNGYSENVFFHEFGHAFAGLADEYYSSDVAYNEFYPPGIEPTEPNITALLDPNHVKWQKLLSSGIGVPTEWGKAVYEKIESDRGAVFRERSQKLKALSGNNVSDDEIESVKTFYETKLDSLDRLFENWKSEYGHLEDKVGVFEGAGYSTTGLYRSSLNCMMKSNSRKAYCGVCVHAIEKMIRFYAD